MTNYNKSLDEVLQQNIQLTLLGELPNAVPDHNNWVNVMGRVYSFDFTEAKQAITSLIKELVAEAKPRHLSDISGYHEDFTPEQLTRITAANRASNEAVKEFEQNLLKALEEV